MLFSVGKRALAPDLNVSAELTVRLMQTTDLHAHILLYDYLADRPSSGTGLSGLAHLIQQARKECRNSLLFDTGDFLQGSPVADLYASTFTATDHTKHPVMTVMNALEYDAGTLGNHDFNYGLDCLTHAIAGAEFPLVCANVTLMAPDTPSANRFFLPPWTMLTREFEDACGNTHVLRIGVIGLLPPQIDIWDRAHIAGKLETRDMIKSARAQLPMIRAAGADLIVMLSHSGIAPDCGQNRAENVALALAALPGIDAVLCGHQHQIFPGPAFAGIAGVDPAAGTLHGKPAVMAGYWGSHLGLIDMTLRKTGGVWHVHQHRSHLRALQADTDQTVTDRPKARRKPLRDDAAILGLMRQTHRKTRNYLHRIIGHAKRPVHSYFALVADDPAIQLVAAAQHDFVATALAQDHDSSLPLLSAVAPFKAGGSAGPDNFTDIAAGPFRIRDVTDLYQFPNLLCAVRVTGAVLADWLEHAAGQFNRIIAGQADQMLLNTAFPSYNFDVICGLRYTIDTSQPARFTVDGRVNDATARRVRDLTWRGAPVLDDQQFIVATNSYRAGGGGGFAAARDMQNIALPQNLTIAEVLTRYMSRKPKPEFNIQPVWRFAAMPGTSVLFDSAPQAAKLLGSLTAMQIECAGPAPRGFTRFRLHL